jgi:hypothetical protein
LQSSGISTKNSFALCFGGKFSFTLAFFYISLVFQCNQTFVDPNVHCAIKRSNLVFFSIIAL